MPTEKWNELLPVLVYVVLATIFTCPRSLSSLSQGKGSTKELGKPTPRFVLQICRPAPASTYELNKPFRVSPSGYKERWICFYSSWVF